LGLAFFLILTWSPCALTASEIPYGSRVNIILADCTTHVEGTFLRADFSKSGNETIYCLVDNEEVAYKARDIRLVNAGPITYVSRGGVNGFDVYFGEQRMQRRPEPRPEPVRVFVNGHVPENSVEAPRVRATAPDFEEANQRKDRLASPAPSPSPASYPLPAPVEHPEPSAALTKNEKSQAGNGTELRKPAPSQNNLAATRPPANSEEGRSTAAPPPMVVAAPPEPARAVAQDPVPQPQAPAAVVPVPILSQAASDTTKADPVATQPASAWGLYVAQFLGGCTGFVLCSVCVVLWKRFYDRVWCGTKSGRQKPRSFAQDVVRECGGQALGAGIGALSGAASDAAFGAHPI
jgi:hypothetical protein